MGARLAKAALYAVLLGFAVVFGRRGRGNHTRAAAAANPEPAPEPPVQVEATGRDRRRGRKRLGVAPPGRRPAARRRSGRLVGAGPVLGHPRLLLGLRDPGKPRHVARRPGDAIGVARAASLVGERIRAWDAVGTPGNWRLISRSAC